MARKKQPVKVATKPSPKVGPGTASSRWPWILLSLAVLLSAIPLGFYLWNGRSGTFNAWLLQRGARPTPVLDAQMESDFSKAFGISPEMSAEFESKLSDGGTAGSEETNRRVTAFSIYIQKHLSSFNADPHEAIREALRDPAAFGLKEFKEPPKGRR